MDLDRLSTGEKIAGGSAVLLFIFMFFDWFTIEAVNSFGSGSESGSAWDALDVIPIILTIAIVAALAVVVIRLTDALFEPPISMNAVVAVLGGISALLILYRIVNPPDLVDFPGVSVDVNPELGVFLGLLAAVGIAFGGYRAMQEEGMSFADVGDQLSSGRDRGPGAGSPPPPSSTPPPPPPPPPSG